MTWTRYDSSYPTNPKVVVLSDAAYRLWTSSIAYGNKHGTDGRVPPAALRLLLPNSRYPNKAAAELVLARMFHPLPLLPSPLPCTSPDCPCSLAATSIGSPEDFPDSSIASPDQLRAFWGESRADGWVVHDFWDLQPKSWEVRQKQKKRAEAGRLGGLAKAKQIPQALLNPDPIRPDPIRSDPIDRERSGGPISKLHELEAWGFSRYGALGGVHAAHGSKRLPIYPHELEHCSNTSGKSWGYFWKVLDSYRGAQASAAPEGSPEQRPRMTARELLKAKDRELEAEVMRRWEALPDDDPTHPDDIREQLRRERKGQAS